MYCLYAVGIIAETYANNIPTLTVSAPENVEINKQFQLTFTISFSEKPAVDIQNFDVLELKGLEILCGLSKAMALGR